MSAFLIPTLIAFASVAVCFMFAMAVVRHPSLASETVDPFAGNRPGVSSQDTIASEAMAQTILSDRPEWKLTMLTKLRDVEDFLDYLENHNIADREVHTLGNSSFAVRWK